MFVCMIHTFAYTTHAQKENVIVHARSSSTPALINPPKRFLALAIVTHPYLAVHTQSHWSLLFVLRWRDHAHNRVTFHMHVFRHKMLYEKWPQWESVCQSASKQDGLNTIIYRKTSNVDTRWLLVSKGQTSAQKSSEDVGQICIPDYRLMSSFLCSQTLDFRQTGEMADQLLSEMY